MRYGRDCVVVQLYRSQLQMSKRDWMVATAVSLFSPTSLQGYNKSLELPFPKPLHVMCTLCWSCIHVEKHRYGYLHGHFRRHRRVQYRPVCPRACFSDVDANCDANLLIYKRYERHPAMDTTGWLCQSDRAELTDK